MQFVERWIVDRMPCPPPPRVRFSDGASHFRFDRSWNPSHGHLNCTSALARTEVIALPKWRHLVLVNCPDTMRWLNSTAVNSKRLTFVIPRGGGVNYKQTPPSLSWLKYPRRTLCRQGIIQFHVDISYSCMHILGKEIKFQKIRMTIMSKYMVRMGIYRKAVT
jgi:hypothetical protein